RQFSIGVGNRDFFLDDRHFVTRYSRGDSILLQKKENNVEACVDGLAGVAIGFHGFLVCPKDVVRNFVEVSNLAANNVLKFVESSFVLIDSLLGFAAFLFEVGLNGGCQGNAIGGP